MNSRTIYQWALPFLLVCPFNCLLAQNADQSKTDEVEAPFFGRVVDTEGNPVNDAKITLQGPSYLQTETDEQGRFWFLEANEAGEYRLRIESSKWVGITDFRKAPQIIVDPDKPTEQQFTLERACQVELSVVDENGEPIQAAVYFKPLAGEQLSNARSSATNADGVALVGGLDPALGKYSIVASSSAHAPSHLIVSTDERHDIQKHRLVLVLGKSIKGKAICSDGKPPAGWSILALPSWWDFGIYPAGAKIEEDGSFELQHVGDETFDVSISIPLGDGMSTSRSVLTDAKLLEMKQPLHVTLDYPSPASMNYLTGAIRWIGKPLASGIRIEGYSADLQQHTSHHLPEGETEFKIGPMPNGIYRIRPEHPEVEVMNLRKIKNLNDLDHVKIPNEEPLQIVLRVRGKPHVQGVVFDAETKQPVQSFRFRVAKIQTLSGPNYVQADNWKVAKGETGSFESDVIGPGVYRVSILADGYAIQTSTPINTDDQPDEVLRLELKRGLSLSGKVVDESGNGVNGATVRALSQASGAMDRVLNKFITMEGAVTTVEGQFTLRNLGAGPESIRVDHPDFAFEVLACVVNSDKNDPLTVHLTQGATVRGTVFDVAGKPQANEKLRFQDSYAYGGGGDEEAGKFGEAITDENGQYSVSHLPEETVYVSRAEEWQSSGVVRQALQVEDGKVHSLDFGGTTLLTGRFMLNEKPLSKTRLQLGGEDSVFGAMKMFTTTDDEGRFRFYGAPAGRWTLYRAFGNRGSEWAKVRDLDVAFESVEDLGEIRQESGRLTVTLETNANAMPQNIQMELRQYHPQHLFGRTAAILAPRESSDSPFNFENVTPGDYEIACSGIGSYSIVHRIEISDTEVNSTIPVEIPVGQAKLTVELKNHEQEPGSAMLMLWSEDERLVAYLAPETGKDAIGTFVANNLPAGPYKLRGGYARKSDVVARIDVVDKQENRIVVTLPENSASAKGVASFVITDENGVFIPCQIRFKEDAGEMIEWHRGPVSTSLSGTAGEYTLLISQPGFVPIEQKIVLKKANASDPESNTSHITLRRLNSGRL